MILIALGSNLPTRFGPPVDTITTAIDRIGTQADIRVTACSRLYRSPPWPPGSQQPDYINAVIAVDTDLPPAALLDRLHAIEADFGRARQERNAPRPLDLDLIAYNDRVRLDHAAPLLPHPRLQDRAFVLLPLRDIAPGWHHPASGSALEDLIAALDNSTSAEPLADAKAR